ncbi:large conductance mechanosensitive channel protein MscL [Dehalogenimonas etheniformans]|uniref:Large-conductance mechanosensitive channel n=1 Tax=Dehalogenimonas etheniformans TaxID=1536648 RepID=A0A2P5P6H8_9CHLR|nr:large conductance mechanosensitive channel protein MscL [Dehalogenimonas etheniformans]PPD57895.1 large conductance mechanosensitive channel protein MscL [Dehalogenimonas etheniformans]QNT75453.1 large conductance mechanosensitive channel protein MscL [Dehalogenimonas etheniformans]
MLKEFRTFIMRGNVVDLAVGIVIGAAFGAVINSFVKDILMPPIGMLLGGVDFTNMYAVLKEGATAGPYDSLAAAQAAGAVTMNFGVFINVIISFLIVAAAIFFVVVKPLNMIAAREAAKKAAAAAPAVPTTKDCPYCTTSIPIKATRCPNCTSELR